MSRFGPGKLTLASGPVLCCLVSKQFLLLLMLDATYWSNPITHLGHCHLFASWFSMRTILQLRYCRHCVLATQKEGRRTSWVCVVRNWSKQQTTKESNNPSIHQSMNQLINWSIDQSINRSMNQPIHPSIQFQPESSCSTNAAVVFILRFSPANLLRLHSKSPVVARLERGLAIK